MYNNVNIISNPYDDIALGKLQIVDFNQSTPFWWQ